MFDPAGNQIPTAAAKPAVLLLIGLLRKDEDWPMPGSTLATVTMLLARSVCGDDWIAHSDPSDFALVLHGREETAEPAATRVLTAISAAGGPGRALLPQPAWALGPQMLRTPISTWALAGLVVGMVRGLIVTDSLVDLSAQPLAALSGPAAQQPPRRP